MYVGIGPLRAKAWRLARQLDPPRTWKELGSRWDAAALQALTVLVHSRLPGTLVLCAVFCCSRWGVRLGFRRVSGWPPTTPLRCAQIWWGDTAMHCVAGNDFVTALKYAKGTLVFLNSPSFNLLLYKSVALSAADRKSPPLAPSEPEEQQAAAAAVAVKVLESMADDEDTTRLAVRLLSQGKAQTNDGEGDTPAVRDPTLLSDPTPCENMPTAVVEVGQCSNRLDWPRETKTRGNTAQERADLLRHELDTVRGRWWHVVCDKQPLAASGPWPASTRLTLQRGKCTYICFRHADDPPTVLTAFAHSPNAQKLLLVCEFELIPPASTHACSFSCRAEASG